jgi:hypothetical protein
MFAGGPAAQGRGPARRAHVAARPSPCLLGPLPRTPLFPQTTPPRHDGGSFFPGTGAATEAGSGAGEGFTLNVPWGGPGAGDGDYIAAFTRVLLPVAYEFGPDLLIVSAGFDAADGDPLGGCRLSPACFGHLTALLQPVAPLVLLLEARVAAGGARGGARRRACAPSRAGRGKGAGRTSLSSLQPPAPRRAPCPRRSARPPPHATRPYPNPAPPTPPRPNRPAPPRTPRAATTCGPRLAAWRPACA